MANTTIKITQLPSIGNGLSATTILPVVNTTGTATTDKVSVGTVANFILTEAGNTLEPAYLSTIAYSVANAAQPNITSVGTLSVNTLKISGGTNGYILQTDGAGNLTWVAGTGSGNGEVGGANGQIQFNNAGNFGGDDSLTWDVANALLGTVNFAAEQATIYGNVDAINVNTSGNVKPNAIYTDHYYYANGYVFGGGGGNGTPGGVTTQVQFNDNGAFAGNTGFTFNKTSGLLSATLFAGGGNGLSNIQGANVSGAVGLATYAGTANSVAGANVTGQVSHAAAANSVAVANVVGLGNIATVALNGSSSQVLYGNGQWGATSTANTGNITFDAANISTDLVDTDIQIIGNGTGNVSVIVADGNVWRFGNDGYLSAPFDTLYIDSGYETGNSGFGAINGQPIATTQYYTSGNISSQIILNRLDVPTIGTHNIQISLFEDNANSPLSWKFDNDGSLTAPGNIIVDGGVDGNIESTGNINVIANNNTWSFDSTGNLTVPGNILGSGNLYISPDANNAGGKLDIFLTYGPDIHIAGVGENLILGRDDTSNVMIGVDGNVYVQSNTGTAHTWTFDGNGDLTVPRNVLAQEGNDLNVRIYNTDNTGGATFQVENRQVDIGNSKTTQFTVGPNNISLITDFSVSRNEWSFDNTGNLTLPGNTFSVNYANGTQVSLGGSYSNADVANYLPTFTGGNIGSSAGGQGVTNLNLAGNIVATPQLMSINWSIYHMDFSQYGRVNLNTDFFANANTIGAQYLKGDGSNISNIAGANISGTISTTGNISGGNLLASANVLGNGYARFTGSFDESQASTAGLYLGYAGGTPRMMFGTGNTSQTFEIDNDGGNLRFYIPGSTKATLTSGGDFSVSGNITAVKFFGSLANGNSNVNIATANGNVTIAAVGNTTMTVTGTGANVTGYANVTGNVITGNVVFAANAGQVAFNTGAYISGNANSLSRDGSILLSPYTGAGSNFAGVIVGGAGRLLAPNGGVFQIFNAADVTFQVATKVTVGTAATSPIAAAVIVTGGIGASGTANTGVGSLLTGPTFTPLANTVAGFNSNVNSYTQVTLQNKSNGADATTDYVLTADNGSDTVNYGDFGIINSGYDNGTPTNSLGNIVYAADTYLYAQGNTSNASQSGGNLAIGTTVPGKNVKIFAGGVNSDSIIANISNTGMVVNGNVTANNFSGNISITGNVTGTSPNVTLVAGSYSYTFDNTGILTLPAPATGNEGGEIDFTKAANSTLSGNTVVIDQYVDKIRFFESGGTSRGAYIDLTQAAAGVGTLLNNRVAGLVNAGTFVTMDNLKATVPTSGNRGLSLATVSGTNGYFVSATYSTNGGAVGGSAGSVSVTTTAGASVFNWNFTGAGDGSTYVLTDATNSRAYRVTLQIGSGYANNMISIERLV